MWKDEFEAYYSKENCIPINMEVEQEHIIIDAEIILSTSKCSKLSDVQELKLCCKNFTLIKIKDLAQCINLRELDLSENQLTEFPRNLNLPNLKFLDITGNPFIGKPLIEQFPNLIVLNVDQYIRLNMDFEAVSYFCPNLKVINYELFNENVHDCFNNYLSNASKSFDTIIRSKWESEFSGKQINIFDTINRRSLIDDMVQQIKDRNFLVDEHLNKYKDLLIFKLTEEYLKSKLHDTEDELLAVEINPNRNSQESFDFVNDSCKKDEDLLKRFVDNNEMRELEEQTDDFLGRNVENGVNHIVISTTGPDGQEQQYLVEQTNNMFHIGQSLSEHKSVAMTIFNPNFIKGRPTAEFLPGELRNKDYVKGDMASDIYQKTVKGPLGQRGLPKSGPNTALSQSNVNGNFKKRGRPPKILGEATKCDAVETPIINGNKTPSRPKNRRRDGELRSLKDLNKAIGSPESKLEYDPLHFIRCHAKDGAPHDQETKVWRCAFEPDLNISGGASHCVATCGGECVCIIDCEVGKVKRRFKREFEDFMALAWTTIEIEPGKKINILAAGGKSKEIRLFFPDDDYYCDMRGHQEDVSALVFNSTIPQILFSGDAKASVFVWDIGSPTTNQSRLMRYQLLMRLRCPRLDLNPVMNLVYLDHYSYLIAGCDDAMFAWKITEYRSEKREREPDMELKLTEHNKIDVPLDCISYDGLAQLGKTALVFRVVGNPSLLVFDFGTTLERRKGLQKTVPIEVCGKLDWLQTDDFYININTRNNLGAVLSGDSEGNIWIYDLDPYIEENPERIVRNFQCSPFQVLEWPDCSAGGNGDEVSGNVAQKHPVINTVDMTSDGLFVVGVTDNNLVCIWKLTTV